MPGFVCVNHVDCERLSRSCLLCLFFWGATDPQVPVPLPIFYCILFGSTHLHTRCAPVYLVAFNVYLNRVCIQRSRSSRPANSSKPEREMGWRTSVYCHWCTQPISVYILNDVGSRDVAQIFVTTAPALDNRQKYFGSARDITKVFYRILRWPPVLRSTIDCTYFDDTTRVFVGLPPCRSCPHHALLQHPPHPR